MTIAKEVAQILISTKAVSLDASGYHWASGIISPIYCDNRILMSHPKERKKIVDFFVDIIKENNLELDVIAGTATAGIPWAAFLAAKLDKPMVYVRSKAKG